jgi:hypothetical protein
VASADVDDVAVTSGSRHAVDGDGDDDEPDGSGRGSPVGPPDGSVVGVGIDGQDPSEQLAPPRNCSIGQTERNRSFATVPTPRHRPPPRSAMSRAYSVLDAPRDPRLLTSRPYRPT